jgi:hypothetical protein
VVKRRRASLKAWASTFKVRKSSFIPAALVIGVLVASFTLPHSVPFGGVKLLTYGYGYGPGNTFLAPPVQYHPVTPFRLLDTRPASQVGPYSTPFGSQVTRDVQVSGVGTVPSTGVTAVVINVTATNTSAAGYLTVFPTGTTRAVASNLNWTAGKTVPNLVEIALGTGGNVSIYNPQGNTDVVIDVEGYISTPTSSTPGADGLFNSLVPARVLDTRDGTGTGGVIAKVGAGSTIDLTVTGAGGVPPTGVEAVVLNVTATDATATGSYVTAWPKGAAQPVASNLNFVAGQTVPNRVIVKVGTGGQVSLFNAAGSINLVADVNGWFTDTTAGQSGDIFVGTSPSRIMDTRLSGAPAGPASTIHMNVAGQGGVPSSGAHSVVLNVTVTNPAAAVSSYLTLWPTGASQPLASDLNFVNGLTVANLTIVKIGASGQVDVYNAAGNTQIVVDVVGWYQ